MKREAGRNCKGKGKNCDKNKRKKKRRNSKKKNRSKKGKKTRSGKKRAKSGKNEKKTSKTKKMQRQKTTASRGEGRQISGNATSCAMKAIKYARLFEGKATSIFRQVLFDAIVEVVNRNFGMVPVVIKVRVSSPISGEACERQRQDPRVKGEKEGRL